jgi:regulator of RNase E activity RraA
MSDAPFPSERLLAVGTAGLSAALRRRGYLDIFVEGVSALDEELGMAGPARTLRFVPFRPDLFETHGGGFNAQKQLFDTVGAGEVIVIEARGEWGAGTLGDILALRAATRGAAGVVTDGGVRDAAAVSEILPVFSSGPHPSVLGRKHVPWEVDAVIGCGGATVVPGDAIVGDGDGVIVIPAALLHEVLDEAEAQDRQDAWVAAKVADGESLDGLFPPNAEWAARYESERGDS